MDRLGQNPDFKDRSHENRHNFTISIFGTGKEQTVTDREAVSQARLLGKDLIKAGFSVATGGYGGVMRAASEGALEAAKETGVDPKGVIKAAVFEDMEAGRFAEADQIPSRNLTERLSKLVEGAKAFIVLGGGLGTVVELVVAAHSEFATRKLAELKGKSTLPKPIIILDPSFDHANLIGQFARREKNLADTADNIFVLGPGNISEVLRIVENYYKQDNSNSDVVVAEREELRKYNLKNFIKNQDTFDGGAGI